MILKKGTNKRKNFLNKNEVWQYKIEIDLNLYPIEAVFNALYFFSEQAYFFLEKRNFSTGENKAFIWFSFKDKIKKQIVFFKRELINEINYATVRFYSAMNFKEEREMAVFKALFSALGLGNEVDMLEFLGGGGEASCQKKSNSSSQKISGKKDEERDPLGIMIPWEEKYPNEKDKNKLEEK